jgi:DNA (cytosine-5)-methyltransferase 1
MFRVADFFAGCGGLSHGFANSDDFQVVHAVDHWAEAARVYQLNHPCTPYQVSDLNDCSVADQLVDHLRHKIDVVVGGPPCQSFSTLGKRRDGDKRSTLVEIFAEMARSIQPKLIIMENVVGIKSKRHPQYGTYLEAYKQKLSQKKDGVRAYSVSLREINCLDYGLAQSRKRVIAVAFREDIAQHDDCANLFWAVMDSQKQQSKTVRDMIGDLPATTGSSVPFINGHTAMRHSPELVERLRHVPPGGGLLDVPEILLTPHLIKMRAGGYGSGGHVKNIYGRLEWDKPSGTIVAGIDKITCGRYIHPVEHRLLTPRECARLQSFPDEFQFSGSMVTKYYLIGNAVPPLISRAIQVASRVLLQRNKN